MAVVVCVECVYIIRSGSSNRSLEEYECDHHDSHAEHNVADLRDNRERSPVENNES